MKKHKRKHSIWLCIMAVLLLFTFLNGSKKTDPSSESSANAKETDTRTAEGIDTQTTPSPFRVCLDPGHGGKDPGALFGERQEKNDTLKIALRVQELLEEQGVECLITHTEDTYIPRDERCAFANQEEARLFIALHRNSGNGHGLETWILDPPSERDMILAQNIQEEILRVCEFKDRGIKLGAPSSTKKNLPENDNTDMPSCVVEIGFVSDEEDNALFDEYFEDIAAAIAQGIMKMRAICE